MRRLILVFAALLASCTREIPSTPIGPPLPVKTPLGLPPLPQSRPVTAPLVALGEKLYFSPTLSADGRVSCASCHDPKKGLADGARFSTGVKQQLGTRNAPTVRNAAYARTLFWDGRAASLEEQARGPITNPVEMAHTPRSAERSVAAAAEFPPLFQAAFGTPDVTLDRITTALAAFERTLIRGNSAFDRFYFGGDKTALSPAAQLGFEVFRNPTKGNCAVCHLIERSYALFTDHKFHNIGAGLAPDGELADLGRFAVTKRESDKGAFRTPSLRDVAETAPYMHDGSLRTLKEVIDFYVGGGSANPNRDPLLRPLAHLSAEERAALVAFLASLTGKDTP